MAEPKVAQPVQNFSIMGLFSNYDRADEGYEYLTELGYDQDHILVVLPDNVHNKVAVGKAPSQIKAEVEPTLASPDLDGEKATKAAEGVGIGSSIGALAGALAMIGTSLVLPSIGVAFLGHLAAGLIGVGGGAAVGGLAGFLYGSGVPETDWPYYPNGINNGKVLIGVIAHTLGDAERISARWEGLGADLSLG